MPELISDGAEFSCMFCTSKLKLSVTSSSTTGESKKIGNQINCFFPPPGGNCTFPPGVPSTPCPGLPPGTAISTGQTTVNVDNIPALGTGCKFMCPKGQMVTLSSPGQKVALHNEAEGTDETITAAEIAAVIAALGLLIFAKKGSPGLARMAPLAKKLFSAAKKAGPKAVSAVKNVFKKGTPEARNQVLHEQYKKTLRRQMEKPYVKDKKLKEIMDYTYRDNAKVGSGSTADAIRHEMATGEKVGGASHAQKGEDVIKSLDKWMKANKNNPEVRPSDFDAAENVYLDIKDSLLK